jgi:protein-S-isoprenylcysteine O-methyltransferase Ste14
MATELVVEGGGAVSVAECRLAERRAERAEGDGWTVRAGEWLFRRRSALPLVLVAVPLSTDGAGPVRWAVAAALLAIGIGIRFVGVAAAGPETRRRTRLVRTLVVHGPYAWTRNPIYVGNSLLWAGCATAVGDLRFACVALLLFALCYSLIVRYEERVLTATFAAAYIAYAEATPRWIPRIPRGRRAGGEYRWDLAWRREWNTALNIAVAAGILVAKARV